MKQVLLAINGNIPTNTVFNYAVGLCTGIRAELGILQFVKNKKWAACLLSTPKKVRHLGKILEDSFAGAAFAEEGMFCAADEILSGVSKPLKQLLDKNKMSVPYRVVLSNGNPETDLSQYIENHHEIILAIFDPSKDAGKNFGAQLPEIEQIRKRFRVPLVFVKS
jgi:hypothetical protein